MHFTPNLFRFSEPMQNLPSGGGYQYGVGANFLKKTRFKWKLLGILLNKTLEFSLAGANLSLAPAGNFCLLRLLFVPNKLGLKLYF